MVMQAGEYRLVGYGVKADGIEHNEIELTRSHRSLETRRSLVARSRVSEPACYWHVYSKNFSSVDRRY
jgi:hypothetical protein